MFCTARPPFPLQMRKTLYRRLSTEKIFEGNYRPTDTRVQYNTIAILFIYLFVVEIRDIYIILPNQSTTTDLYLDRKT